MSEPTALAPGESRLRPAEAHGPAQLAAVLEAGGPPVWELLAATEERLLDVARSQGEALAGHAVATLDAGGKRLRPILTFLCAGQGAGEPLVRAGTAVELVHMATLVHDDVLDRATLRRGRPTVFVAGGRRAALATGDLLFSRAFAELAPTGSAEAVSVLSAACSALARGELMQRADAWSRSVTEERYLERCALKTARLFEAACRLGAIFGDSRARASAEQLALFGLRIGLAFQIFDDVLDVSGPAERTGKHRGADLLDGTVTLPLILARRRDAGLRALDLRAVVHGPDEAESLCDRIAATGSLEASRRSALELVAQAKSALESSELDPERRRALDLVADGVVERYA